MNLGRRDYATRRAARIERLANRAERLRAEGNARLASARQIGSIIPMGQPILVGHHSEKRHRRDIARIDAGYRKGFAALKAAEENARRADSAEENRAISSDDPEALVKLRDKLASLNADRARGVALNKAQRAKDPIKALAALGVKDPAALLAKLAETTAARMGDGKLVPSYRLTNLGAEARRVEKRIADLERRAARPETPPETIGEVTIREEENRVQISFPGKPADAVRADLKRSGFRFAPTMGAWDRMASNRAWYEARRIAALGSGA